MTMTFSASTIANSARRVRQRRRHEQDQQQQQQQQQQQPRRPSSQSLHCPPLSPGESSSSTNSMVSVVREIPVTTAPAAIQTTLTEALSYSNRETATAAARNNVVVSPQSMIMSMSSVHGLVSCSPESLRAAVVPTTTTTTVPSHFRRTRPPSPPSSSSSSPSRSWDESDHRPPSPSIQRASSWTLQPKLIHSSCSTALTNTTTTTTYHSMQHHPPQRRPRIVAELGSFATASTAPNTTLSSFRRVNSSPMIVGPELLRSSSRGDDDCRSVEGTVSLGGGRSRHSMERPPTPTPFIWNNNDTNSIGVEEITLTPGAVERQQQLSPQNQSRACVSPARSTASSSTSVGSSANNAVASLRQLCQVIQQNGPRPNNLSLEEKAMWDAIQTTRRQARLEGVQQARERQEQQHGQSGSSASNCSSISVFDSTWETRLGEIQEQAVSQQRDNSRSLQAIQRVLADVQAERDQAVLRLQDYHRQPSPQGSAESVASSVSNAFYLDENESMQRDEKESMQKELKSMSERIIALELELKRSMSDPEIKVVVESYDGGGVDSPVSALQQDFDSELVGNEKSQLQQEKEILTTELEWKTKEVNQLLQQISDMKVRRDTCDSNDTAPSVISFMQGDNQLDGMRKELAEKTTALENAKMIIVSLENASGSLAADLRRKLRERDDDMAQIQKELVDKQRTLDTLAMELRDLQKLKATTEANSLPLHSEAAQVRRLQLSSRLEANLAEIRAAVVILESTQDPASVSNISHLLTDCSSALKEGVSVIENGIPDEQCNSPLKLHQELEEKKKVVQRLEEILRTHTVELDRFKTTTEAVQRRRDEELHALHAEIKILRQQCNTNVEVLARKDRELAVLRDSLRVEDDGVGYISDDDDADDDELPSASASNSPLVAHFAPSQAEALATLLSHGGNHSFDSGTAAAMKASTASDQHNKELDALKSELSKSRVECEKLQRQHKVEKESLSNAKMIISSLERASKSMMEDLRARLQDSNTAIASLLEKSMESERISAKLRMELDTLKRGNRIEFDDILLALPPPPQPLLLTETID